MDIPVGETDQILLKLLIKNFEGMLKSTQTHRYWIIHLVMKTIRISDLSENLNIILTPSFNLQHEKFKE